MPLEKSALLSAMRLTTAGELRGTAFVVSVQSEADKAKWWPYVLTADHNIRNQIKIAIEVPNPDPEHFGELSDPIDIDQEEWRQPLPGVDLAIARFPAKEGVGYQALRTDLLLPRGIAPLLGAIVSYVGIFAPLDNVPMARVGNLAARKVAIKKTYDTHTYRYTGHLMDCRSYNGFSGAPCFSQTLFASNLPAKRPAHFPEAIDGTPLELRSLVWAAPLAGVFTAHYTDEGAEDNPADLTSRYGVGVMLSSDHIWEALEAEEAQQERREWDEERQAATEAAQPPLRDASVTLTEAPNDEFENFEDLTRKLVQTPKPEK